MTSKLAPWRVPNFVTLDVPVLVDENGKNVYAPSWPIQYLLPEELSSQCDDFREEAFRKAGLKDPKRSR